MGSSPARRRDRCCARAPPPSGEVDRGRLDGRRNAGRHGTMFALSVYATQALHGVVSGMLLFLVASGLTLVFGMMGILNIAHAGFCLKKKKQREAENRNIPRITRTTVERHLQSTDIITHLTIR